MIDKIIELLEAYKKVLLSSESYYKSAACIATEGCIQIVKAVAAEGDWIKCSDRLPENQLRVLVKTDKSPLVVGWLMFGEWYTDFGQGYGRLDVIAWQPLPEPYKERD